MNFEFEIVYADRYLLLCLDSQFMYAANLYQ